MIFSRDWDPMKTQRLGRGSIPEESGMEAFGEYLKRGPLIYGALPRTEDQAW